MMRKSVLLAALAVFLLFSGKAFGFGGCEENCEKCHSLDAGEAKRILTKMHAPDAEVKGIKMSPIRGLWEVTIEDKGKPGIMYVGFSKTHVVGGAIFEVETAANKTQETLSELNKPADRFVDVSKIPHDGSLILGEKSAAHKVFVFTDPDCPFCGKLHSELEKIVSARKDIAFYIKLMPLRFHPDAYWKSQSIMCRKSMKLLEDNFQKKPVPKPDCETKVIDENIKLGGELDITGTPTMVLPDGLVVVGMRDAASLTDLIGKHSVKSR